MVKSQKGFHHIVALLIVVVLTTIGFVGWHVYKKNGGSKGGSSRNLTSITNAAEAGKQYSNGACKGTDVKKLNHLPIDAANINRVLPYGGTVGAHVMPISHGYIWPGEFNSPRDAFNVYAMADSTLYSISSRSINVDTGQAKKAEYSLNFSVSCVEFYYYDLITSLTPDLQKILDAHPSQSSAGNSVQVNMQIKAGQLVGKIGGQTLDYAVWDFNKTLTGYIVPEHYEADFPRIHLVSPFEYSTDDVKQVLLAKNIRSTEPVEGKVDYDIDGKLIGGWFEQGSGYYGGHDQGNGRYWTGHLAIVPNELDPTFMTISTGTYEPNDEAQFAISRDAPDPKTIGVETGLVKYDLYQINFMQANGSFWDRMTFAKGLKATTNGSSQGCGLFQLTQARKLKAEFFPKKICSAVPAFSSAAKVYER